MRRSPSIVTGTVRICAAQSDGPLDALDHASPTPFYGGKIGIDATKKGPEDGHMREWPDSLVMDAAVKARIDALWGQLGL